MRLAAFNVLSVVITGMSSSALAGWIDVKTGKPVTSRPVLLNDPKDYSKGVRIVQANIGDPKSAFDPVTGRNFALDDCGNWIDVKTGKPVTSRPVLLNDPNDYSKGVRIVQATIGDPKSAFDPVTGRNFALEPCSKTARLATPQTGMIIEPKIGGGLYVGLFGGGVSHDAMSLWFPNPDGFGADALLLRQFQRTVGDLSQPGFIGGGQIGYDTKISFDGQGTSVSLVVGLVADIAGTTGDAIHTAPFPSLGGGLFPIQNTFNTSFVTTERARIGFNMPVSPGLAITPYVTGGFAAAQIDFSDGMFFPTSFNRGRWSEFRPGWAAGGGVDIKLADSPVTIQAQYLHTDFGDIDFLAPNSAFPLAFIATHHMLSQDRATIGVNAAVDAFRLPFWP